MRRPIESTFPYTFSKTIAFKIIVLTPYAGSIVRTDFGSVSFVTIAKSLKSPQGPWKLYKLILK